MVNSLRKVDFSHHTYWPLYMEKIRPPLIKTCVRPCGEDWAAPQGCSPATCGMDDRYGCYRFEDEDEDED